MSIQFASNLVTSPCEDYPVNVDLIALMGPTGSGKSTFINTATRMTGAEAMETSASVKSCTGEVRVSERYRFQGRDVQFIDTPGFDDTEMSDVHVLRMISAFLKELYKKEVKLAGIIYTKDISQIRMSGSACRNLYLFRRLTGDEALKHVAIVTTMWGRLPGEAEGLARLSELEDPNNDYFGPLVKDGAKVFRYDNTPASADAVLGYLLSKPNIKAVEIQREMVDEKKQLDETRAGVELGHQFTAKRKNTERSIVALKADMDEAASEGDEKSKREMEAELARLQEEVKRLSKEGQRLKEEITHWLPAIQRLLQNPLQKIAKKVGRFFFSPFH